MIHNLRFQFNRILDILQFRYIHDLIFWGYSDKHYCLINRTSNKTSSSVVDIIGAMSQIELKNIHRINLAEKRLSPI